LRGILHICSGKILKDTWDQVDTGVISVAQNFASPAPALKVPSQLRIPRRLLACEGDSDNRAYRIELQGA
jgi:hypothetical protein